MPTLFMIKIGARPKGRLIEQHDMFFGVGAHISDFVDAINTHWPEVKNAWHLDAYRQVTVVDGHRVQWQPNIASTATNSATETAGAAQDLRLFFINLGGYAVGEFEEYHHKLLIVAPTQAQALKQARRTAFYQQYGFSDADSVFDAAAHIDDKQQVDIDEIYDVNDLLTGGRLVITPLSEDAKTPAADKSHIGYLSLKKLKKMTA